MRQLMIVIVFVVYMYFFLFSSFSGTIDILDEDEKDFLAIAANSSLDFSNVSDSLT